MRRAVDERGLVDYFSCGTGSYDDRDDLVFAVGAGAPDTTPPTTAITAPAAGSTVSGTVNVTASASDNVGDTRAAIASFEKAVRLAETALEHGGDDLQAIEVATGAYDAWPARAASVCPTGFVQPPD